MTTNQSQTYLHQLASALEKHSIKDIDDILADYQDYFAQSKAKGYSDAEAIRRLPSTQELADSYNHDNNSLETAQVNTPKSQPSSGQRVAIFTATLAGDFLMLPILFITILMLACFGIVGAFLTLTGPLLFIPDNILGQIDVMRPSLLQIIPTSLLFVSLGVTIMGICVAICERLYSAYRASIVVRRWILTGRHNNHLKLVPSISKQLRTLLYRVTVIAGAVAALTLLILVGISWFTEGTVDFPSTWN